MSLNELLNILIYEGINAILEPFGDYLQVQLLIDSIKKRLQNDFYSKRYDFRGYIKTITRLESTDPIPERKIKKRILSKINGSLKRESVKKITKKIKKSLDSDIYYITLDLIEKNFTKTIFYQIFGAPDLDIRQKIVFDLIWNTFHEEVLKIVNPNNLLLRLYQQGTAPDNIKQIINYNIETDAKPHISKDKRNDYKKVWEKLIDLEVAAEKLWDTAKKENLDTFLETFWDAKHSISKCDIFYESKYHAEIHNLFETFQCYQSGKKHLIKNKSFTFVTCHNGRMSSSTYAASNEDAALSVILKKINKNIEENFDYRLKYIKLLNSLFEEFHQYITKPLEIEGIQAVSV